LEAAYSLWVAYYNLCRVRKTLHVIPAMEQGITDHAWSIAENHSLIRLQIISYYSARLCFIGVGYLRRNLIYRIASPCSSILQQETFFFKNHLNDGNYQPMICAEETMGDQVKTDFLYAQPSFGSGAARVFDLFGQFDEYNISETPAEADGKAIASDWLIVGQDIVAAIEQNESEMQAA
jgi:hypothetical protein